ncbi:MAG TPA: glycosyltransferase family 39 protein [Pyrinomonadaceae bacterium]|nr:glycosyltransferase family 39 protein [Pyrinomonadaceae bacterium]
MPDSANQHRASHRQRATLALLAALVAGVALYAANAESNPRGFYIDESSVAYNAHLIATTGRDEHGEAWPLFFRAFGDYKNPTYVYMLAALYSVTGPGVLTARLLSAMLGVAAAFALGLLGARVSGRRDVGLLAGVTALLTPWLFELSRVVVEVAAYPLALALFLLCARRASERDAWSWTDVIALATTLALLTYTYSIGRLLGPLLALGLALLATRARLRRLLLVWALYALALVPMIVFALRHPDALSARFKLITFITPQSGYADDVWQFAVHYAANLNPWRMLVTGDPSTHQIANIYGVGLVLSATFALALAGAYLVIKKMRREPWWRFVFYGLAASFVPASLTNEQFHMLRLAAVPVFLVVLTVPALAWLVEGGRVRRIALAALVALTLAQGALFQWQYRASAHSPRRLHLFDAEYPSKIFQTALDASPRRIYLADAPAVPGYIQALWQATLRGVPLDTFVLLPQDAGAPEGAVFITTDDIRPRCRELAVSEPYKVCVAEGAPRVYAPLPASGLRAELRLEDAPALLRTKEKARIRVVVRNAGDAVWLARERGGSPFQLSLGNRWLDRGGNTVINDDGRGALTKDLRPGEEAKISFTVNAPRDAGDYLLEIDVLQEGVSWFGLKGSKTLRVPVRVE